MKYRSFVFKVVYLPVAKRREDSSMKQIHLFP